MEGRAEGHADGMMEMILQALQFKFNGEIPPEVIWKVNSLSSMEELQELNFML
ncbi:MAG: hypothetical protein Q4C70_04490 [Planctomycetia bacterium]|nr:hypothetical protein [Planctomycetia bacterium]